MKRSVTTLLALVLLLLTPGLTQASEGLGISISFERSEQTDAEIAGSVWIGIEQGEQATRTILVESLSSDTVQQLEFEILDRIRVDGESQTDFSKPGFVTPWVSFDPPAPLLQPGETVAITMTVRVPEGAAEQAHESILRVLAGAVDGAVESDSDAPTQAIVGTKVAISAGMWLGVGDALDLAPDFEISGIDGVLVDGTNYVRIFFENTGIMPIRPTGAFQLSDPSFLDRVFEPVDFQAGEILSDETGFVDVPVEPDVVDGFYRAFVTAQSGTVRKTRLFEGEIVFDDPNQLSIPDILLRSVFFVLAAIGLVVGVRMLRRPKDKGGSPTSESEPRSPRRPRAPKSPRKVAKEPDPLVELQLTIARMEKQLEEMNREAPKPVRATNRGKPATASKSAAKAKTPPRAKPENSVAAKPKPATKQVVSSTAKSSATKSATTKKPASPTKPKPAAPKPTSTTTRVRAAKNKTQS